MDLSNNNLILITIQNSYEILYLIIFKIILIL